MTRLPLDGLGPAAVEAAIATLSVERLSFYGGDGRQVAIFSGDDERVFFRLDERERARMNDGLIVHNHPPRRGLPPDDPRYDVASFSPFDWRVAVELNVRTMIVVSPTWRHELLRPPDGWLAAHQPEAMLLDMLDLLYDYVAVSDKRRAAAGEMTDEAAEATRSHRVNELFADEIGATYRRERR